MPERPNRQEMIRRLLLWESFAAEAKARAARWRAVLAEAARAELAEQGTAPTWRLPELATVSLPVSKETVYVTDEQALLKWVKDFPGDDEVIETVERIKPDYLHDLLNCVVRIVDGQVLDDMGTVVPGLAVRAGGMPGALTVRPTPEARQVTSVAATELLDALSEQVGDPLPDQGAA